MSVPDHLLDPDGPSAESAERQEAWFEEAEREGCEACGGQVDFDDEYAYCLACNWAFRIPWEEF